MDKPAEADREEELLEEVDCPLCGSAEKEQLFATRDRLHDLEGVFTLMRCQRCGLLYLSPRPTRQAIGRYYPDDYFPYAQRSFPPLLAALVRRWGGAERRVRAVMRFVPRGRLLDIGCGAGDFLEALLRHEDWEAQGGELNRSLATATARRLGIEVFGGELTDADLPEGYFDVVTLWNVLEHLFDPLPTLRRIHGLLRPGGLLALSVPNTEGIDARLFGPFWVELDSPRHLALFSPRNLDRALCETGFHPLAQECFYGTYTGHALSLRFLMEERWGKGASRWAQRWVVNNLALRLLMAPCCYAINHLRRGSLLAMYATRE